MFNNIPSFLQEIGNTEVLQDGQIITDTEIDRR